MFGLVHFSIKIFSNTCSELLNLPKFHKKKLISLNEFILASNSPSNCSVRRPQLVQNMNTVRKLTTMVQTFDKNDWYQVMGHLEKCAFETNAAIALLGIRPY